MSDAKKPLLKNFPPIDVSIQIWQWRDLARKRSAGNERAQIMSPLCVAGIAAADDGGHESFRAAIKLITHFAVWARARGETHLVFSHDNLHTAN